MTAGTMVCAAALAQLPLFVGGDLDEAVSRRVSQHLRDCPPCRRAAGAQLRALRALARAAAASPVPGVDERWFATMHDEVMQRVARIDAATPGASPMGHGTVRRASAAAAAVVLFALGWVFARPDGGLMDRPPIQASGGAFPGGCDAAGRVLQKLGQEGDWSSGWPVNWPIDDTSFTGVELVGQHSLRTLEAADPVSVDPDGVASPRSASWFAPVHPAKSAVMSRRR